MKELVMAQLHPANIEINLVGDIDGAEVDEAVLRYLGTVAPRKPAVRLPRAEPPVICNPPPHVRHQAWHLEVGFLRQSFCMDNMMGPPAIHEVQ
jgi:hypothetical protein